MNLRSWNRFASDSLFPEGLPSDALLLAGSPDMVVLCRYGDAPDIKWSRADVFTPDWNLRLRRLGGTVRAVGAGPVPGVESWDEPAVTESLDEATESLDQIVLWGRQNAGESLWLELRIPHLMTTENHLHPKDHGSRHRNQMVRRCLQVVRYDHDGEVLFHRYTRLRYARADSDDTTFQMIASPK